MTTTLLAVDDSKTMRKVLEITFAGEDEYRAVLADSAEDALTKLRANKPKLVLVDAALSGTNGYDLCQKIKAEAPGTAIVLLSSKQQPFDRGRGSSVGVDDFIDKPFDTQQLIDKVGVVLKQAAQAPSVAAQRAGAAAPMGATRPTPAAAQPSSVAEVRPRVPTVSYGASTGAKPAPGSAGPAKVGVATQTGVGAPAAPVVPVSRPQAQVQPSQPMAVVSAPTGGVGAGGGAGPRPVVAAAASSTAARPAGGVAAVKPTAAPVAAAATAAPTTGAVSAVTVPAAAAIPAVAPSAASAIAAQTGAAGLEARLQGLGLSADQLSGVLALSKEVVERVVWEVVPVLAETLIREEIERLTKEPL